MDSEERVDLNIRASNKVGLIEQWMLNLEVVGAKLIRPTLVDETERLRQSRLLIVLICAPFMLMVTFLGLVVEAGGGLSNIVAAPLFFALALLLPSLLITTCKRKFIEPLALAASAIMIAALIKMGGGLSAPLTLMTVLLVVEVYWVARTRFALLAALIANVGIVSVVGGDLLPSLLPAVGAPSSLQWLPLSLYIVFGLLRLPHLSQNNSEISSPLGTSVIGVSTGGITGRLDLNGEILEISAGEQVSAILDPSLLLGSGLFNRLHVADRVLYLSAIADVREGKQISLMNLRVRLPAEKSHSIGAFYQEFSAELFLQSNHEIVLVLRDETVIKNLEGELTASKEIVHNSELEQNHLFASVSHEMRTPLNAIVGFSDVLANEMFGKIANEQQREYITLIREAGSHLLNVVNSMLDVSKMDAGAYTGELESFNLSETVDFTLALIAREANSKHIALTSEISGDLNLVRCDRRALQQVLINLLSNAVKFTNEGSIKVSAFRSGQALCLSVSDTGRGIKQDDLIRLGTPYMQAHSDMCHNGTGLGMTIVNGLVKAMEGSIKVESIPGYGTQVHVTVGLAPDVTTISSNETDLRDRTELLHNELNNVPFRKTA